MASAASANNVRFLSRSDQGGRPDGVQVLVHKGHAFIGHMFSDGFTVVDVRDPAQYEQSHVAGAISIWLDDIEANPTGLDLDKDQWIITYCT